MAMSKPAKIASLSSSSSSSSPSPPTITATAVGIPPWLDLHPDIVDLILDRLLLFDYVRFSAVCSKWRATRKSHLLRYSPNPPPKQRVLPLIFPKLVPFPPIVTCYSPFESKTYRFNHPQFGTHPSLCPSIRIRGWFLLQTDTTAGSPLALFNPVSNRRLEIPHLPCRGAFHYAISSPPNPPPNPNPNCCVLGVGLDYRYYLFRLEAGGSWTRLPLPTHFFPSSNYFNPVVFCCGKFYCLLFGGTLVSVDPLTAPASPIIRYMQIAGLPEMHPHRVYHFLECDGNLLLVVNEQHSTSQGGDESWNASVFEVFRIDIGTKEAVRMDGIGRDWVLLLDGGGACSVPAADVRMHGNCILFPSSLLVSRLRLNCCLMLDLETGRMRQIGGEYCRSMFGTNPPVWFVPSMC